MKLKIIDFHKKGNQVKLYLGKPSLKTWHGDDWDDISYEHNAGEVYDEFVETTTVLVFDFDDIVVEPADGIWSGSGYCKDDMIARKVPFLCVLKKEAQDEHTWYRSFSELVSHDKSIKYYFGDEIELDVKP